MTRCILVVGIGASGTSMIAGCLHKMGICMGHEAHLGRHPAGFSLYEDAEFYGKFHGRMPDRVYRDLIARHQRAPLWGWKNTLTAKAFPWLLDLIPDDVRIVAVHRELLDSVRGRMQGKCPPGQYYTRREATAWALKAYVQLITGLQSVDVPTLHLGFEEVRRAPGESVARMAAFVYDGVCCDLAVDLTPAIENVRRPNKEGQEDGETKNGKRTVR